MNQRDPQGGRASRVRLFVDAIDDELARVMWNEDVFSVPVAWLPADVREGDWLHVSMALEEGKGGGHGGGGAQEGEREGDDSEQRRQRLAKDDPGGDIKL